MHVRTVTTRRKGKVFRYTQLVQSYRRDDGMPAHRVVASLGQLPEQTAENLKLALQAGRKGKALVVPDETPGLSDDGCKVKANLRYLDVAVILELWRRFGLGSLLRDLLPSQPQSVAGPASDIVTALAIQRSVSPGSKLYAQRWYQTTALPELLSVPPKRFNNTRLHRVLDELFVATPELQNRLPCLYEERNVGVSALFMDVTNTYFEGAGCEMAQSVRTKEGLHNKKAIGIVLLVNELGYPLRWQVVPGKTKDHLAMAEMVSSLKSLDWLQETPLICDRAMGRDSSLRALCDSGLHFLTATPVNCIESYVKELPYQAFSKLPLELEDMQQSYKRDFNVVVRVARELGLEEVDEELFIENLGVVDLKPSKQEPGTGSDTKRWCVLSNELRLARQIQAELDSGKTPAAVASVLGLKRSEISRLLKLLCLASETQDFILTCPHDVRVSKRRLARILKQADSSRQRELLLRALQADGTGRPERLRMVTYFNPKMFIEQCRRSKEHLQKLERFVGELNQELAQAQRSRSEESTRRKIVRQLENHGYCDAFEVLLHPIKLGTKVSSFQCELKLKPEEWTRRQRYNGFVLLLGHPELKPSGRDLALLYRAKDVVEKDFQTIKSAIKLRPLYHYTDPKVQAHVTICMLSLLLQRILERSLRSKKVCLSAAAALEILGTCHLNQLRTRGSRNSLYSVTEATTAQQELLKALDLTPLVDDAAVSLTLSS